jgi:hypothetical protein
MTQPAKPRTLHEAVETQSIRPEKGETRRKRRGDEEWVGGSKGNSSDSGCSISSICESEGLRSAEGRPKKAKQAHHFGNRSDSVQPQVYAQAALGLATNNASFNQNLTTIMELVEEFFHPHISLPQSNSAANDFELNACVPNYPAKAEAVSPIESWPCNLRAECSSIGGVEEPCRRVCSSSSSSVGDGGGGGGGSSDGGSNNSNSGAAYSSGNRSFHAKRRALANVLTSLHEHNNSGGGSSSDTSMDAEADMLNFMTSLVEHDAEIHTIPAPSLHRNQ